MRKRQLILACVLILLCILLLVACNNNDKKRIESESIIGEWKGKAGKIAFLEDGEYISMYFQRYSGSYTLKGNKITRTPPVKYGMQTVYTYSIVGDTLTFENSRGEIFNYTKIKSNSLLGVWRREDEPGLSGLTIAFLEDGTYMEKCFIRVTGSYSIKGNEIGFSSSIRYAKANVYTYSIEGDTLTIKNSSGGATNYTRIGGF
ncbi:MAG: META domain-containing protein [Peptococcaceae bacterium]|nr:META domain-containing protein [Peptococcaceae bacterium]